jgi:hypothetical protein
MRRIVSLVRFTIIALLISCGAAVSAWCGPTVLFDQGHGQRFFPDKPGPLDLSSSAKVFRDAGYTIRISDGGISDEALAGVDALVVSGTFHPYSAAELETVTTFLGKGGRLCITLHIGVTIGDLLHHIGVDFSNGVIHETENQIMGNPLNFQVTRLESHPLTAGLKRFNVYGAWALMNMNEDARIVALTSPTSWVDLDGNQKLSYDDVVQSFGVVVAGRYGRGEFVVFGDDAIFQNKFLGPDNLRLARNLAEWLKGAPTGVMTGSPAPGAGI